MNIRRTERKIKGRVHLTMAKEGMIVSNGRQVKETDISCSKLEHNKYGN
jgi:hypothetical protein